MNLTINIIMIIYKHIEFMLIERFYFNKLGFIFLHLITSQVHLNLKYINLNLKYYFLFVKYYALNSAKIEVLGGGREEHIIFTHIANVRDTPLNCSIGLLRRF